MNDSLTEKVIAAAFQVYNGLGFGFLEKVYENALLIEMESAGITAIQQPPLKVYFKGYVVGSYFPDLIVENQLVVEVKSLKSLAPEHEAQLIHYLTATGTDIGLLLNFGEKSVQVKRKYRLYKPKS
ncbi:MAG: GxxExxY protein [Saprospirales bacterium]|nr:GxxExxY protein [Saprospirales bacterium]MBK8921768.1 GxxExxY protein [Saprospirales bacterium]